MNSILEKNCTLVGSFFLNLADTSSSFDYVCTKEVWEQIKPFFLEQEKVIIDYPNRCVSIFVEVDGTQTNVIAFTSKDDVDALILDHTKVKTYLERLPTDLVDSIRKLKNTGKVFTYTKYGSFVDHLTNVGPIYGMGDRFFPGEIFLETLSYWIDDLERLEHNLSMLSCINVYRNAVARLKTLPLLSPHGQLKESMIKIVQALVEYEFKVSRSETLSTKPIV